jgi:hypothetical protein
MGVALGWVAFALAGVAAAPHAERAQSQLTYTVRMLEVDGVGWREDVYSRLKPVTRQGSATIWTVPRATTMLPRSFRARKSLPKAAMPRRSSTGRIAP